MLRYFFKFLNVIALVVLLLSCMAEYIAPSKLWQLSFIGFAFPVVLIVNVCFLILWILKRDAFGLFSLIGIVLTWNFIQSTFALNFKEEYKEAGIKLMAWNVKNFDLYNWTQNEKTRERMMDLIRNENPDVLCMQEFYSNNQLFKNVEFMRDTLGYKYFYFPPVVELNKRPKTKLQRTLWRHGVLNQRWGVATFSKFPIIDTGSLEFNNSHANNCIYTDIDINGKSVRVYNVHLQSMHLGYDDYATIDSLEGNKTASWRSLKNILRKVKRGFTKRPAQTDAVAEHIAQYEGTPILCGDFNDVPVSYTYNTAIGNLQDAFVEKGKGFGATYAYKASIFRIDYTLFDERIKINSCKTIRKKLSDHYPVVTTFSLN